MRVLFLAWRELANPQAGGSELLVDRLAGALTDRGHEVALVCGGPTGTRKYTVVANGGRYTQYLSAPFCARRHVPEPDVVVDVENGIPFFSPLWSSAPVVCFVHHIHSEQWGMHFPKPVAAFGRATELWALRKLYSNALFAAASPSTAQRLVDLGVEPSRIRVVPPGVDSDDTQVDPSSTRMRSEEPLFVALGRLVPHKRIDLLLAMWETVRERCGGRLVVVGDGPEAGRLSSLRVRGVEFAGRISDEERSRLLSAAWLLVHTASHEGFGIVILEAADAGTPTLAFDVPGVRDAVVDGVTGRLVRTEAEFVEEWIRLASKPELVTALGTAARRRARRFTWGRSAQELEKLLALARERHVGADHRRITPGRSRSGSETDSNPGRGRTNEVRTPPPRPGSLPPTPPVPVHPSRWNASRSLKLVRLFAEEATDPASFYEFLARDTVSALSAFCSLAGLTVVDIGGGPGWFADEFRRAGSRCLVVEYSDAELRLHRRSPKDAIVGDGCRLPLRSRSVDVVHCANVLEHVRRPWDLLEEMVRVLRVGGTAWFSFTNWLSPWGGHETSPWHYMGGRRAAERYTRRYGRRPKNLFGESLFPLHIGPVLGWFRANPRVEILWAGPRYLPGWTSPIIRIPGVREVLTWNLAVTFRRVA
ncbi:MAG: hypothetical protein KatS3mg008_0777 [Acidimicrobiales bacterium]|nr:MAG: hypothetical protein KatS3mg008_0777 [Acidimicrobiales bacterium]